MCASQCSDFSLGENHPIFLLKMDYFDCLYLKN